jgi:nitrite reductase (NADH) small subunit
MPDFIKVATTADVAPGQGVVIEVDGRPIALFNVNGQFCALDNVCVHRGGPLGEGFVDSQNMSVQCPWHGWTFSLTDGQCQFNPTARVGKFDVMVEGTDVLVSLD